MTKTEKRLKSMINGNVLAVLNEIRAKIDNLPTEGDLIDIDDAFAIIDEKIKEIRNENRESVE